MSCLAVAGTATYTILNTAHPVILNPDAVFGVKNLFLLPLAISAAAIIVRPP